MQSAASPSTGATEEVITTAAPAAGPIARPQVPSERLTVSLIPAVAGNLRQLQARTNLSKTDIANRAITSYEFLDAQLQAGRDLIVRDRRTGETQLVRFL
jgi:hypothetical protein